MKQVILTLLTIILLPLHTFATEAERVLLIGNSYTYCNDLPGVLMALSEQTDRPLHVESYTVGGMSLRGFLNSPEHARARQMLESGDFDWVILQDQSQTPAYRPDDTLSAVRRWAEIAAAADTRVVLFLTWAHAYKDKGKLQLRSDMQQRTGSTYCRAAVRHNAAVAPVGEAWAAWYRKHPDTPLHVQDGSHPNPCGTYLAACVIHGTISGKAPKNLPGTLRLDSRPLISIPASTAAELQSAAAYTLKHFTPARYLAKEEEREADLLSVESVRREITRGTHISDLIRLAGKPIYTATHGGQHIYQFRIRGGKELCAYCSSRGIIEQLSIASPGSMAEIIDLR